jgi:hypothetical protein
VARHGDIYKQIDKTFHLDTALTVRVQISNFLSLHLTASSDYFSFKKSFQVFDGEKPGEIEAGI